MSRYMSPSSASNSLTSVERSRPDRMSLNTTFNERKSHMDMSEPKSLCLVCQKRRSSNRQLGTSDVLDRLICSRSRTRCAKIKLSLHDELSKPVVVNYDNASRYGSQPYGTSGLPTGMLTGYTKGSIAELAGDTVACGRSTSVDTVEDRPPVVNLDSKPRRGCY